MVSRTNRNGETIDEKQAVTLTEALSTYTLGSAYAAFEEDVKGRIEVGKLADLTVVDHDPYTLEQAEIAALTASTTIVGGRIAFARRPSP